MPVVPEAKNKVRQVALEARPRPDCNEPLKCSDKHSFNVITNYWRPSCQGQGQAIIIARGRSKLDFSVLAETKACMHQNQK